MIDLHAHLLPGIDDGAESLAEALAMCQLAAADGCRELVATPHQRAPSWENLDRSRLQALFGELQEAVGDTLRLHLGAEVRIDSGLLAAVRQMPGSGLLPLAGSRYLLLELDRGGFGPDPAETIHEVGLLGYRPILAHPELYSFLEPHRAAELVDAGAYLQLTAMSIIGEFGRLAQRRCRELLDGGLAAFVASDSHGIDWRPPGLGRARAAVARQWGEETAERLFVDHPRAVLEDRPLSGA